MGPSFGKNLYGSEWRETNHILNLNCAMNYTYDLGAVSQPNVFQSREDVSLKMMFVSFQSRNQKYICLSPVTALHILSENMVP